MKNMFVVEEDTRLPQESIVIEEGDFVEILTERALTPKVGMSSPWGRVQSFRDYGEGVFEVETPSHGGIYVPDTLLSRIPEEEQRYAQAWSGSPNWYEEDVAAASVIYALPELFPHIDKSMVDRMYNYLKKVMTESVQSEASKKTKKCPNCGTEYLAATGYCLKCKKKVAEPEGKKKEKEGSNATHGKEVQERMVADYVDASVQLINRTGMDVAPLLKSDSREFLKWLNEHFGINQQFGFSSSSMWFNNKAKARGLWDYVLAVVSGDEGYEIQMNQFIDHGTQWSAMRSFLVTEVRG